MSTRRGTRAVVVNPTPELARPRGLSYSGVVAYDIVVALLMRHGLTSPKRGPVFTAPGEYDRYATAPVLVFETSTACWKGSERNRMTDAGELFPVELDAWLRAAHLYPEWQGRDLVEIFAVHPEMDADDDMEPLRR
jgi:hypothetical protein